MPVIALQHVRRMRGGANSHLLRADDGRYYIVKFRNNPQHERILANELICYVLLDSLRLPAPEWEIVEVPRHVIEASPELTMDAGAETRRCEPGLQFGSRFPGDPACLAVYDYLPVSLLRMVVNVDSFRGMVAFDKWVGNADGRQAVFFRDRAKRWLSAENRQDVPPRSLVYVASMIDHGFAFHAHNWDFVDSPEVGLYARREVYESVRSEDDFQPWLGRIESCPAEVFDDALKRIPPAWFGGDWDGLEALLERLYRRRGRVGELLRSAKQASRDPFPGWSLTARSTSAGGGR